MTLSVCLSTLHIGVWSRYSIQRSVADSNIELTGGLPPKAPRHHYHHHHHHHHRGSTRAGLTPTECLSQAATPTRCRLLAESGRQSGREWAWVAPLASPRHAGVGLAPVRPFPPIFMGKVSLAASCAGPSSMSTNPTASPQLSMSSFRFPFLLLPPYCHQSGYGLTGPGQHRVPFAISGLKVSDPSPISFVSPLRCRVLCHHRRPICPCTVLGIPACDKKNVGSTQSMR